MKVTLIPDRCIACGLCQTYSELFDYHDNGIVKFAAEEDDLLEKEVPQTMFSRLLKNAPLVLS